MKTTKGLSYIKLTKSGLGAFLDIQYCAKVMQTKFDKFRSLFSRTFERNVAKFRAISSEKFDLETILHATFCGNIARYFGRSNEKLLLRKFVRQLQ